MKEDPEVFESLAQDPGIAEAAKAHADACGDCDSGCPACAVNEALRLLHSIGPEVTSEQTVNVICHDRQDLYLFIAQVGMSTTRLHGLMRAATVALFQGEFDE